MRCYIPEQVKVGSQLYQVKITDLQKSDRWGHVDYKTRTIYISRHAKRRDRTVAFFHELLHVCDNYSGNTHNEEFIKKVAPTLAGIFEDNEIQRPYTLRSLCVWALIALLALALLPKNMCVSDAGRIYFQESTCSRFADLNVIQAMLVKTWIK